MANGAYSFNQEDIATNLTRARSQRLTNLNIFTFLAFTISCRTLLQLNGMRFHDHSKCGNVFWHPLFQQSSHIFLFVKQTQSWVNRSRSFENYGFSFQKKKDIRTAVTVIFEWTQIRFRYHLRNRHLQRFSLSDEELRLLADYKPQIYTQLFLGINHSWRHGACASYWSTP